MKTRHWSLIMAGLVTLGALGARMPMAAAQAGGEAFSATATVKGAKARTAPVVVVIDRYTTDEERRTVVDALRGGGAAARQALEKMPAIGQLTVGEHKTAIKYAYARPAGGGRLVTVISDKPLGYLERETAAPKEGYDLAFALLNLPASGKGSGELGPASKVKVGNGAIVTEDYGSEVVTLSDVERKK
jgi:hypothetical protein